MQRQLDLWYTVVEANDGMVSPKGSPGEAPGRAGSPGRGLDYRAVLTQMDDMEDTVSHLCQRAGYLTRMKNIKGHRAAASDTHHRWLRKSINTVKDSGAHQRCAAAQSTRLPAWKDGGKDVSMCLHELLGKGQRSESVGPTRKGGGGGGGRREAASCRGKQAATHESLPDFPPLPCDLSVSAPLSRQGTPS